MDRHRDTVSVAETITVAGERRAEPSGCPFLLSAVPLCLWWASRYPEKIEIAIAGLAGLRRAPSVAANQHGKGRGPAAAMFLPGTSPTLRRVRGRAARRWQLRHARERSDCGAAFERRRRLDPREGRAGGFIGSSIKSCCKTEVAAPVTACRGRTSDLPAPPTIAEPAKQKQNDQDDDDEGRC
jgi:hypothetical protein